MRTIQILIALSVFHFDAFCQNDSSITKPQHYKVVINEGVGFSSTFASINSLISYTGIASDPYTFPCINAMMDYEINQKFSLGARASWQYDQEKITNTNKMITATIYRGNIGARVLYHFMEKRKIDLYAGLSPGISIWYSNFPEEELNYYDVSLKYYNAVLPSIQALVGIRYYCFHIEGGIGSPCELEAGFSEIF